MKTVQTVGTDYSGTWRYVGGTKVLQDWESKRSQWEVCKGIVLNNPTRQKMKLVNTNHYNNCGLIKTNWLVTGF